MTWRRPILGALVAMVSGCSFAQAPCSARTPEQALPSASVVATHESASDSSSSFYRLARIVVDPELHRSWALIANCTHPERPLEIVALSTEYKAPPTVAAESIPSIPSTHAAIQHVFRTEGARTDKLISTSRVPVPTSAMLVARSTPDPSAMVPLIRAGDLVRLWSSDGNVRLEMAVVSLEYGRVGQIVHVRRLGQTALLAGVVVGKDSAELIP
jgi:hypothetical protein